MPSENYQPEINPGPYNAMAYAELQDAIAKLSAHAVGADNEDGGHPDREVEEVARALGCLAACMGTDGGRTAICAAIRSTYETVMGLNEGEGNPNDTK